MTRAGAWAAAAGVLHCSSGAARHLDQHKCGLRRSGAQVLRQVSVQVQGAGRGAAAAAAADRCSPDACVQPRRAQLSLMIHAAVAIAFEEQVVDSVPATEDDYRMDVVLTPSRLLHCSEQGRRALV